MAGLPSRGRACQAAISPGEAHGAIEPGIPECDLARASARDPIRSRDLRGREPPELKHLSKGRKRKKNRLKSLMRLRSVSMPGVGATETGRAQTEPCGDKSRGMWCAQDRGTP